MPLSAQEYKELKELTAKPGIDDATRTAALEAIQGKEDDYIQGWGGAAAPAPVATPEPVLSLTPRFDLPPQALATQPSTTHPEGDDAAAAEFLAKPEGASRGTVFVYEPPLKVARDEMMSNPAITRALFPDVPPNPEDIAKMTKGDSLYQAYADYKWRETAAAAVGGGKTAYRYSMAPYLHDGKAMGVIDSLGMKAAGAVKPASEGITSFVMGVDKHAALGAARAAQEVANPTIDEPTLGMEQSGGIPQGLPAREHNAMVQEDNPTAYAAGEVLGTFAPWSLTNRLFGAATGAATRMAGEGAGLVRRGLASAAGAGAAGMATQAGQEVVNAGANLAEHGETATTIGEAATRVGVTGGVSAGMGAAMEGLGGLAKRGADLIANGSRYRGIPGELERAGTKFGAMGPKLSPETQALVKRAQAIDAEPGDMLAREIAPRIKEAADVEVKSAIEHVTARKQSYYATAEGKQRLPATNVVKHSLNILRRKHDEVAGKLKPLDVSGTTSKVRGIFNNEVGGVSLKPVEGAIELSPQEAETFLSTHWRKQLRPPKAKGPAPSGGSREVDLDDAAEAATPGANSKATGGGGLARSLQRRGIDKVYVVPRRHDAQSFEEVMHGIKGFRQPGGTGNSSRELQELDGAARLDRDARPRANEPGGWSAMQAEHAQLLEASKALEKLVSPKGQPFKVLAGYGKPKSGELLTVEALRKAADKSGTRELLEQIRHLDRTQRLREAANYGPGISGPRMGLASPGAHLDAATIRAFPALRYLGGNTSPLRGGRGGALGPMVQGEEKKDDQ